MSVSSEPSSPIPAHVRPDLVVEFDVYNPPGGTKDWHLAWKRLQDEGAPEILWTPCNGGHWIPTRAEAILEISKDYATFGSDKRVVPAEHNPPEPMLPIMVDPPVHTPYRALINPALSPAAINALEDGVRALAISLIEEFQPRGECDFVADFAQHLPIAIFMKMVDLPLSDRVPLMELAEGMIYPTEEKKSLILDRLLAYLATKVEERRKQLGTDLISRIIEGKIDGRPISDSEALSMLSNVMIGGLDTVMAHMGFVAMFLARNPGQRRDLAAHPELIPNAVEEFLRRFPPAHPGRMVAKDTVFRGVEMKRGDLMVIPETLYGLDDRAFDKPLDVDFRRPRPISNAFGAGPHRCPGSYLARTEMKVFIEEWLKRIPDFEVKPGVEIHIRPGVNGSIHYLPLIWQPK